MIESLDEIGWVDLKYGCDKLPKKSSDDLYPNEPIYPEWKYRSYPSAIHVPDNRVMMMIMRSAIGLKTPEKFYIQMA